MLPRTPATGADPQQAHRSPNSRAPAGDAAERRVSESQGLDSRPVAQQSPCSPSAVRRLPGSTSGYLSSLVSRSTTLLNSLKQQYSSSANSSTASSASSETMDQVAGRATSGAREPQCPEPIELQETRPRGVVAFDDQRAPPASSRPRPPLPPPPPREVLQAARQRAVATPAHGEQQQSAAAAAGSEHQSLGRRDAMLEHSLERDAALSLKDASSRLGKHKRAASIKNALRHAHLGPLRPSGSKRERRAAGGRDVLRAFGGLSSQSLVGEKSELAKSQPYELFEPPVTQRSVQRSRRRDAMMAADTRRQMSADVVGLRQLTDEYLRNAGVEQISISGQCSLVALDDCAAEKAAYLPPGVPKTLACAATGGVSPRALLTSHSSGLESFPIESQLYQASKSAPLASGARGEGSEVSAGESAGPSAGHAEELGRNSCQILPGNLPWQTDVSIQCELLPGDPLGGGRTQALHPECGYDEFGPYETTGDILNTIAGPFRSQTSANQRPESREQHLSSTLRRGLTAISQNHLSPAAAPALHVVGSLKKSLSNTFDMSLASARTAAIATAHQLHAQDSLPAYASLENEPETEGQPGATLGRELAVEHGGGGGGLIPPAGLIGQLACKLGRQSSKKLSAGKRGIQRALSFDCRSSTNTTGSGKRLDCQSSSSGDHSDGKRQSNDSGSNSLVAGASSSHAAKSRAQNRSTLGLHDPNSPRPYLPQSASQVDFQVPLLPYHKMQEAIVSQRLLEPLPPAPPPSASGSNQQLELAGAKSRPPPDADELLCGGGGGGGLTGEVAAKSSDLSASDSASGGETRAGDKSRDSTPSISSASSRSGSWAQEQRAAESTPRDHQRKHTPPKLVLNIPTIATSESADADRSRDTSPSGLGRRPRRERRAAAPGGNSDSGELAPDGEEVCAADEDERAKATVIVCLPSPNVTIELPMFSGAAGAPLTSSPSFCIDPKNQVQIVNGKAPGGSHLLTASDVFARSSSFIKRPSTLLSDHDAMTQVAQALESSAAQSRTADQVQAPKGRRRAIVPPKLATDASASDGESGAREEPPVGRLLSLDDGDAPTTGAGAPRKRSGGSGTASEATVAGAKRLSGSQSLLPTFYIESECEPRAQDARASREDSGSRALAGSPASTGSGGGGGGGLTVALGSQPARRRSSIAVIPQMQICPGDLLIYSKHLIDRMNQPEEAEHQPAQFLTIDDKKSRNIWASLGVCVKFDSRTMRARNELLCSLDDVLSSLQPSTFVDEQLSRYKGMLWDEFLCETESRRSASSEVLARDAAAAAADESPLSRSGSTKGELRAASQQRAQVAASASSGPPSEGPSARPPASRSPRHTISSRFREKPKLKRGQTVDSVFRIPLIPSSPLKHAQQHQQTPTAHLETHDAELNEDDERPSTGAGSPLLGRRKRSSSARSRSGSQQQQQSGATGSSLEAAAERAKQDSSSFETDDAADLVKQPTVAAESSSRARRTPNQIARQSSLSTISSTVSRTEQKRQRALWDLFQSECTFFFDHLMTLKNVYMEPLKKIQVEGFAMFADPDVLFGNLDELCCGVYDFCKEFLQIITRTLRTRPEELNATDVLIKLYKKNPKIEHLRAVYHRYTLNYINALTYLESLRRQLEFVEFERWSSRDVRCKKLQLTDLLVAPVQHIMRVPIILRDIESHTEHARDRDEIRAILAVEEASLRELDDKMRWLKNFERLLEIQKNISWPNVSELDPKLYIAEFLKEVLSKQPCEKLIVSPRRQIVHEGTLSNYDQGKPSDMHVILFDDMLLLTRRKKGLAKRTSAVCKTNSGGPTTRDDGSYRYIVYKQPLSLDRFYVHDVQQADAQSIGTKHFFMLIVMNRFQQITHVHSFAAPNDDVKQTWLYKIKRTAERWKKSQFSAGEHQQLARPQPQQSQWRDAGLRVTTVQQPVPIVETSLITASGLQQQVSAEQPAQASAKADATS